MRGLGAAGPMADVLVNAERLAATAGRRRVRVLDREAAARDRVHEVHFGAGEVANADRIHEQLDAMRLEHLIARTLAVFFDHQAVLESGTAAALHAPAQPAAGLVFL